MFMSTVLAHSKVVEVYILIAEELLACPADQDFVRKETSRFDCNQGGANIENRGYDERHEMHYKRQLF